MQGKMATKARAVSQLHASPLPRIAGNPLCLSVLSSYGMVRHPTMVYLIHHWIQCNPNQTNPIQSNSIQIRSSTAPPLQSWIDPPSKTTPTIWGCVVNSSSYSAGWLGLETNQASDVEPSVDLRSSFWSKGITACSVFTIQLIPNLSDGSDKWLHNHYPPCTA